MLVFLQLLSVQNARSLSNPLLNSRPDSFHVECRNAGRSSSNQGHDGFSKRLCHITECFGQDRNEMGLASTSLTVNVDSQRRRTLT